MHTLNLVAASFSSPSLPPAIDNRGDIVWPVLPKIHTSANAEDQVYFLLWTKNIVVPLFCEIIFSVVTLI